MLQVHISTRENTVRIECECGSGATTISMKNFENAEASAFCSCGKEYRCISSKGYTSVYRVYNKN